METRFITFNCNDFYNDTKRVAPFTAVECRFFYQTNRDDKELIDDLLNKGASLAGKVTPKAANSANYVRGADRILNNCIAGLVAEYLWQRYLNRKDKTIVIATTFSEAKTQIDLEIISNKKKIEVRSSFPYAPMTYVLCHGEKEFDILGSYANSYKAGEIEKDFYVRTLFRLQKFENGSRESFVEKLKLDGYEAYLTGGATFAMMIDENISKIKDLNPEDSISIADLTEKTEYRVVPFSKALDTPAIYDIIYKTATNSTLSE